MKILITAELLIVDRVSCLGLDHDHAALSFQVIFGRYELWCRHHYHLQQGLQRVGHDFDG